MKRFQVVIALLLLAAAVGLAFLLRSLDEAPAHRPEERLLPVVQVMKVEPRELSFTIASQGSVAARRQGPVGSEVSGRVVSVSPRFQVGNFVKEGEELLAIDRVDYELAVAEAEAALIQRRIEREDRLARFEKESLTVRQADAALKAAEAHLQKTRRDRDRTTIRAPYNGVILQKGAEAGQFISRGATVAQLSGSDLAEVRLPVNPGDILLLTDDPYHAGSLRIPVTLTRELGGKHESRTADRVRIEGGIDAETRVFYLVAEIRNPYRAPFFPVGQFVTATIGTQPVAGSVELPVMALHEGDTVFLLQEGKLKQQPVTVLYRRQNVALVTGGLVAGSEVVTSRLDLMFDGMAVQVAKP